jgi:alpha-1,3-mannosyltransferase
MRVVHVVRQFSPATGGLEETVLNLCREQRIAGCEARVVTLDRVFHGPGTRLPPSETVDEISVARIPYRGSSRYPLAPTVLAHLDADVVHVHGIDYFYDFLAWTKAAHRRPLIATTHGVFFHTDFARLAKMAYFRTVTRLSTRFYDAVIACSESDAEVFRAIGRAATVIENGVNLEKLANRASKSYRRTIICFGRISSNKRIDALFPTLRELNAAPVAAAAPWSLIVAGRPCDVALDTLAQQAARDGVAEHVYFRENPTDAELGEMVGEATYFASSSSYEGFGIAAIEAMSAGLVPILSDIPPFTRLVRRSGAGIAVDFSRPQLAARTIADLESAVRAGREAFRHRLIASSSAYSWRDVARAYIGHYARICARRDFEKQRRGARLDRVLRAHLPTTRL